ncbi:MAG: gamma-glutamyl-gamma-aminobutyrate hydrolase family protein [bacterium]|nr:gamma-glutamyl-gamma-aminobutyrate hydrolase family protein [bacterium]
MPRPRIGITCDLSQRKFPEEPTLRDRHVLMDAYVDAVVQAGGVPMLLPALNDEAGTLSLLDGLDALIISGGGHDLDPATYGEKRRPSCGPSNVKREVFELSICRSAMSRDIPVLGICGGMQVMNVAADGTLLQDIDDQVKSPLPHRPKNAKKATYTFHPVKIFPSCLEGTIGAGDHYVNSAHHQSVKEPGPGMAVVAISADGVIEAIESPSHRFVLGVQWHPESMAAYGFGECHRAEHLFARFVDEARAYDMESGVQRQQAMDVGAMERSAVVRASV